MVAHLPQVAAFADNHLVVTKAGDGLVTASGSSGWLVPAGSASCRACWPAWRIRVRRAHAEELLAMAAEEHES